MLIWHVLQRCLHHWASSSLTRTSLTCVSAPRRREWQRPSWFTPILKRGSKPQRWTWPAALTPSRRKFPPQVWAFFSFSFLFWTILTLFLSLSVCVCAGCLIFILSSDALENVKCLFVLRCAAVYDKRVVVLHPKDTCPFPKFEEQPLEFRDTVMMEDVLIYSQGKHNAVIKELDEKLQLVGFLVSLSFFFSSFFSFSFFLFFFPAKEEEEEEGSSSLLCSLP